MIIYRRDENFIRKFKAIRLKLHVASFEFRCFRSRTLTAFQLFLLAEKCKTNIEKLKLKDI